MARTPHKQRSNKHRLAAEQLTEINVTLKKLRTSLSSEAIYSVTGGGAAREMQEQMDRLILRCDSMVRDIMSGAWRVAS